MAVKQSTYRTHMTTIIQSLLTALLLVWKHFKSAIFRKKNLSIEDPAYFKQRDGVVTTLYPFESIPVPDNGRYRLHNEMEDCIVCDLCVKACPVDCIIIDPIKSSIEIGKTSDGSPRRIYAATFDIDMAKCCYCGLCTTVCPTESLTMTKAYDYSEYDIRNMVYNFADLTSEEAVVKRKEWDDAQLAKQAAKEAAAANKIEKTETPQEERTSIPAKPKPFIPKAMPVKESEKQSESGEGQKEKEKEKESEEQKENQEEKPKPKVAIPPFKIKIPPLKKKDEGEDKKEGGEA